MTEPLVFQHGAAATAFKVAIGVWVAFELVMIVRQSWRLGRRPARDSSGLVLAACIAGPIFAAVRLGQAGLLPWPGGPVWPLAVGLVLLAGGIGLRAWSISTLGRFFQYRIEVQPDHQVVTDGPYRYVRQPSYSGLALILAGIGLAAGDVLSLVVVVVLGAAGLAVRIHAEERTGSTCGTLPCSCGSGPQRLESTSPFVDAALDGDAHRQCDLVFPQRAASPPARTSGSARWVAGPVALGGALAALVLASAAATPSSASAPLPASSVRFEGTAPACTVPLRDTPQYGLSPLSPGVAAVAQPAMEAAHRLSWHWSSRVTFHTCPPKWTMLIGDSLAFSIGLGVMYGEQHYGVELANAAILGCAFTNRGQLGISGKWSAQPPGCAGALGQWAAEERAFHPRVVVVELGYRDEFDWRWNGRPFPGLTLGRPRQPDAATPATCWLPHVLDRLCGCAGLGSPPPAGRATCEGFDQPGAPRPHPHKCAAVC